MIYATKGEVKVRAQKVIASDKGQTVGALRKFFPETDERTLLVGYEALLPALSTDGLFTEEGVKRFLDVAFEIGLMEGARLSEEEGVLWTNEFMRLSVKR